MTFLLSWIAFLKSSSTAAGVGAAGSGVFGLGRDGDGFDRGGVEESSRSTFLDLSLPDIRTAARTIRRRAPPPAALKRRTLFLPAPDDGEAAGVPFGGIAARGAGRDPDEPVRPAGEGRDGEGEEDPGRLLSGSTIAFLRRFRPSMGHRADLLMRYPLPQSRVQDSRGTLFDAVPTKEFPKVIAPHCR